MGSEIEDVQNNLSSNIESVQNNLSSNIESVQNNLSSNIESVQNNLSSNIESVQNNLSSNIESTQTDVNSLSKQVDGLLDTKLKTQSWRITTSGCNTGLPLDYDFSKDDDFPGVSETSFLLQKEFVPIPGMGMVPASAIQAFGGKFNTTVQNYNYMWNTYSLLESDFHIFAGDNQYNEHTFDRNIGGYIFGIYNPGQKCVYDENNVLIGKVDLTEKEVVDTMEISHKNTEFKHFLNVLGKDNAMVCLDDHDYAWNNSFNDYPYSNFYGNCNKTFWKDTMGLTNIAPKNQGNFNSVMRNVGTKIVQLLVLETHYYADVEDNGEGAAGTAYTGANYFDRVVYVHSENATYFGEEQWAWLELELMKEADLRVITLGPEILYSSGASCYQNSIQNYPFELQRLSNLIRKTKANGIVFIACDSHLGLISKSGPDFPYPIYNIQVPSLDHNEINSNTLTNDKLAIPNYPSCESSKQQQTGIACIDFTHDVEEPYVTLSHKRIYGVGVAYKDTKDSSLWSRELSNVPKIDILLSDLIVKDDVPEDFDWKTDMTTYPLKESAKVETKDWVPNQILTDVQVPFVGPADYKMRL